MGLPLFPEDCWPGVSELCVTSLWSTSKEKVVPGLLNHLLQDQLAFKNFYFIIININLCSWQFELSQNPEINPLFNRWLAILLDLQINIPLPPAMLFPCRAWHFQKKLTLTLKFRFRNSLVVDIGVYVVFQAIGKYCSIWTVLLCT